MLSVRKTCPLKIRLPWNLQLARSIRRTVKHRRFVLPTAEIIRKTNKNKIRMLIAFNSMYDSIKAYTYRDYGKGLLIWTSHASSSSCALACASSSYATAN